MLLRREKGIEGGISAVPELALFALQERDELDSLLGRRTVSERVLPDVIGQVELNVRFWWVELAVEPPPQLEPVVWAELRNSVEKSKFNFGTKNL